MMKESLIALCLGFCLDLLVGDPHFLYHPIRLVGNLISLSERVLRKCFPKTEKGEFEAGVFLVLIVTGITSTAVWGALYFAGRIHPFAKVGLETLLCYWMLATRALKDESMKVYDRLKEEDLEGSRLAVSMIVGRDTENLSAEGVTKAAVETIAENASDGVIAPMLFLAAGGAVFGAFYKAVNTMDSMVGYKNERYLYFGRAAAKLDDVLNYLPSRISAYIMILSAAFCGLSVKGAWHIFRRDRRNHASPNSAQTEAVMAGALGIQLAGDAWYFGKKYRKPVIGDALRLVEYEDIRRANRLLYAAAVISLGILCAIKAVLMACF